MTKKSAPKNAAIYVRISLDKNGEGAGVRRQEKECRELAKREGLTVSRIYTDNSVSAYSGAKRPAFDELLADVQAGLYDAVIVWATDRLYRRMTDLEVIIEALGDVPVHAVTSGGKVDLSTPGGRLNARMLGSVAAHESEQKSARQKAANRQRAQDGISRAAVVPFGWRRAGRDEHNRTLGLEPDPITGPVVAEMYARFLAGGNLSAIARWLNDEGYVGSRGGKWTQPRVSTNLRMPRHGGLVSLNGEMSPATNAEGRIVSEADWRLAQAILNDPKRRLHGRPVESEWSGRMACYKCGGSLSGAVNHVKGVKYKTFACQERHVNWKREVISDRLEHEVVAYLVANADVLAEAERAHLHAMNAAKTEQGHTRSLDRLREDRDALASALARGELTAVGFTSASNALEAQILELEKVQKPSKKSKVSSILSNPKGIETAWANADLDARRSVLDEIGFHATVYPVRSEKIGIDFLNSVDNLAAITT